MIKYFTGKSFECVGDLERYTLSVYIRI